MSIRFSSQHLAPWQAWLPWAWSLGLGTWPPRPLLPPSGSPNVAPPFSSSTPGPGPGLIPALSRSTLILRGALDATTAFLSYTPPPSPGTSPPKLLTGTNCTSPRSLPSPPTGSKGGFQGTCQSCSGPHRRSLRFGILLPPRCVHAAVFRTTAPFSLQLPPVLCQVPTCQILLAMLIKEHPSL